MRSRSAARIATAPPTPIRRCDLGPGRAAARATTWRCCATPTASAASNGSTTARAGGTLIQRSIVDPKLEWEVSLVKDSVDPASPHFNAKAARAKLMSTLGRRRRQLRLRPRRRAERPRARRRQDGLLHLPPVLDDELRRLPSADRGELEDRACTITRARRRAISRPTTRRSRATTCSSSACT